MKKIKVFLSEKKSALYITAVKNTDDIVSVLKKYLPSEKILIISDSNVSRLYLNDIKNKARKNGFEVYCFVFKAGEEQKNISVLSEIYDYALSAGIDRKSSVVALGGGVTGDMAGLFASTYMRGLTLIQIPTTLLAMVDSAIGGKTAVNLKGGKNIVGTFYQPLMTLINVNFLKTLPDIQFKNGMAEVIKYAVSFDKKFFDYIKKLAGRNISGKDMEYIIYRCCKFKTDIVRKDEKEKKGIRELLNFGHTFAHGLETITDYKKFLHGEAVAIGMIFAAKLGAEINFCNDTVTEDIRNILNAAGFNLNCGLKAGDSEKFLKLMKKDKKAVSKKIKFVLPEKIGCAVSKIEVDDKTILKVIKEMFL